MVDLVASAGYTPAFTTGKFGQALTNAATNLQGYTATGNNSITTGAYTVEAWLKTSSTAVQVAYGSSAAATWFGANGGKATAVFTDGQSLASSVTVSDGAWHHVAVSSDGSTQRMFVDGVLQASRSSAALLGFGASTGNVSGVGWHSGNTSFGWIGQIDELRISNTARYTAAFTPASTAFGYDTNTANLWHLDGNGLSDTTPPPAGGNVKVWTGTGFAVKPVKVWTGTAWVAKPVKQWNGTAWVKTTY